MPSLEVLQDQLFQNSLFFNETVQAYDTRLITMHSDLLAAYRHDLTAAKAALSPSTVHILERQEACAIENGLRDP